MHKLRAHDSAGVVEQLAEGRAVVVSLAFNRDAWSYRGIKEGRLPHYDVADRVGHSVALVGYRTQSIGREFLVHKSWGTSWSENGYGWISERTLKQHLLDALVMTVVDADGGCGKCASTCPSGLPAFRGVCLMG